MSVDFPCPECGRRLRVGPELAGKKVRCPGCRKVVPAPAGSTTVTPAADLVIPLLEEDPPPPRDAIAAAPIAVVPLDLEPQQGPAAEHCCPGCGRFLAPDAVICVDCGYNRKTGKQLRTVSRRFERHWYLGGFASPACVLIVVVVYLFLGLASLLADSLVAAVVLFVVGLVPAVLLLGTFTRIRITRDRDGRPLVIRDRWLSFLPLSHAEIELEGYGVIHLGHQERAGDALMLGLMVCLFLFGLCPGFLVWMLLFRGSTFTLEIAGEHTDGLAPLVKPAVLYRGPSEVKMRQIGDTLKELAELHYG
jgi:hypothetical protein